MVVGGRVYARSWTRKPDGWFATFLEDPIGVIGMGSRRIRVRAVRARGKRLYDAVERAYAEVFDAGVTEIRSRISDAAAG